MDNNGYHIMKVDVKVDMKAKLKNEPLWANVARETLLASRPNLFPEKLAFPLFYTLSPREAVIPW